MAYVNAASSTGNSATPSVAVYTGAASGHRAALAATIDNSGADFQVGDWPTGFSELAELSPTGGDGQKSAVGEKILSGADSGSYTFGSVGGGADWVCQDWGFSGRHASTASTITSSGTGCVSGSPPNLTVTAPGQTAVGSEDALVIIAPDPDNGSGGHSSTAPTNYTQRTTANNSWVYLAGATRDNLSAGATGNLAYTLTLSTGSAGSAVFLILIPAAAGGGGATLQPIATLHRMRRLA